MASSSEILKEKRNPEINKLKNRVSKIRTPNLLIRHYEIEDAEELIQILKPNIDHMLPWIPWAKEEPESLENKQHRIQKWQNNHRLDIDYYTYGIFTQEKKMIGTVYVFSREKNSYLEIGYWIDKNETGKGYATECTYAITKLIFKHINIEKTEIHCDITNTASAKIPYKLGFTNEYNKRKLEKDENEVRRIQMVWVMFKEEFIINHLYEPVVFIEDE